MDDAVIPLADAFEPATREQWLSLVDKTIKGAALETLESRTRGGAPLHPLYVAEGEPPVATLAAGHPEGLWDLRVEVRHPDPAAANAEALEALAGGATSVLLRLDPTGESGVAVGWAEGLARVLDGVMTDVAPVALEAGLLGPKAADWLDAVVKASPAAPLQLNLDPLSAFAEAGASPGPIEAHLISAANVAARLAVTYPKAGLFLATGRTAHEAGAGEVEEVAMAAAAGVAYARALVRAGLPMADALSRIVLGVAVDGEYFASLAKARALRTVWRRICEACGQPAAPARLEARSSRRMLTRADAWTNMIRLTAAGFAAAVGGADSLVLGAFTDAIGLPTAFARRQARNSQLILMEEAYLGRVADPGAGAWFVERLTGDIAAAAWARFQAIEAAGGLAKALEGGLVAEGVRAGREDLAARIKGGELAVLGVTKFPNADDKPPAVEAAGPQPVAAPDVRLPGPDSRCPALTPIRLEELAA